MSKMWTTDENNHSKTGWISDRRTGVDVRKMSKIGTSDFIKESKMEKKTIYHTPDTIPTDIWAYKKDVDATSKALEELEAEYDDFICNTWVEYADEPDDKLTSDARKLRDRMRRLMNQKILSERDQYKKALDVAMKALTNLAEPDGQIMHGYNLIADGAIKDIEEIMKRAV